MVAGVTKLRQVKTLNVYNKSSNFDQFYRRLVSSTAVFRNASGGRHSWRSKPVYIIWPQAILNPRLPAPFASHHCRINENSSQFLARLSIARVLPPWCYHFAVTDSTRIDFLCIPFQCKFRKETEARFLILMKL